MIANKTGVTMENKNQNFVEIMDGKITYSYNVNVIENTNKMYSGWIPNYDIYFSAPTRDELLIRSEKVMRSFFRYWIKQEGWKSFFLQMNKLGFRADNHDFVMMQMLKGKRSKAKMNARGVRAVPENFLQSETVDSNLQEVDL